MAQILPSNPSWQETLGTGLGSGISGALQQLTANKLHKMQQQEERSSFENLLKNNNYSAAQASLIAGLPESQRLQALQSLNMVSAPQQQGQVQQNNQPLEALLQRTQDLGQKPSTLSALELLKANQQAKLMPGLQQSLQQQQGPEFDFNQLQAEAARQGLNLSPEQQNRLNSRIQEIYSDQGKRKALEDDVMKYLESHPELQGQQIRQEQPNQPLFKKPLTESERIAQERLNLKKQEMSAAEKREAFKITKEERKEINDKAKEARRDLQDLDRLEELEKEGKLNTPGYVEFLERSGFNIPALMEPGSQEYNKIVNNFVRGAKSVFSGRITNQELEQYMRTLPGLSMSPEGRKRVIANLRMLKQGDVAYSETAREIIKENRGIPPLDLVEQLEDRVGPKLDKIAINFRKNLLKEVPKGQNKLITGLQAALGGTVGALPGVLKSVSGPVIGGLAGNLIAPGVGTVPGAILGGLASKIL